jgi:hypothetical protein
MVQVIKQTRKQKIKMYMALPKAKLAELLCNCNEIIDKWAISQKPSYMFVGGKHGMQLKR